TPGKIARPYWNTSDRNAIRQWKRGHGANHNVGSVRNVPKFNLVREAIIGCNVRVWLVDGRDKNVPAIRCGIEGCVICRLPHGRDGRGYCINQGKLRLPVIIEEILVMLVAESIANLIAAALSFLPVGLLNARARGHERFGWRRAQVLG